MNLDVKSIDIELFFRKGGYLEESMPNFEFRPEQIHMSEFILERLYNNQNGLVEAGTGVGKTLAYLVSAIKYALETGKRIAVSTETKALQKQLIDKDMPVLKKIFSEKLGIDFSCSLCLGGSNYPCKMRFDSVLFRGAFSEAELSTISHIKDLFDKGEIFTRFDLRVSGKLWKEIHREGDACDSFRCGYSANCPFQKARKEWAASNILIMNHYLFFTNLASNKVYLPQTEVVIFDEAHSIEDIACSQLGMDLSYSDLLEILALFHSDKKKKSILSAVEKNELRKTGIRLIKRIGEAAADFFEGLRAVFSGYSAQFRVLKPLEGGDELIDLMKQLMLTMNEIESEFGEDNPQRIEFDIARGQLFSYIDNFNLFYYRSLEDYVYWIERDSTEMLGDIHLKAQPVDVSETMARDVLDYYESSIMVSATLSVRGNFDYITGRLGIHRQQSLSIPSAFDFKTQMALYIARDLSEPDSTGFVERASAISAEIIKKLKGNCLMLFTSYKMLSDVKERLEDMIDHPIYSQDTFTSAEAVDRYIEDENSLLMGTHSFWQGIDLKGDLLRGVIMMRLPFTAPDSPPFKARVEKLEKAGLNPFKAYQIPEAVIKFRQGFGRLIRSGTDKGIVAVLDPRVATKFYGKDFIDSIPECRIIYSLDELFREYDALIK